MENPAEEIGDQCLYTNIPEKGLSQHIRMKHRISQLNGTINPAEEDSQEVDIVTLDDGGIIACLMEVCHILSIYFLPTNLTA